MKAFLFTTMSLIALTVAAQNQEAAPAASTSAEASCFTCEMQTMRAQPRVIISDDLKKVIEKSTGVSRYGLNSNPIIQEVAQEENHIQSQNSRLSAEINSNQRFELVIHKVDDLDDQNAREIFKSMQKQGLQHLSQIDVKMAQQVQADERDRTIRRMRKVLNEVLFGAPADTKGAGSSHQIGFKNITNRNRQVHASYTQRFSNKVQYKSALSHGKNDLGKTTTVITVTVGGNF